MKKIKLDLDDVRVQSFDTTVGAEPPRGTVRGQGITDDTCGYASCTCATACETCFQTCDVTCPVTCSPTCVSDCGPPTCADTCNGCGQDTLQCTGPDCGNTVTDETCGHACQ